MGIGLLVTGLIVVIIFGAGIKIIRPDSRGLIETLGKYKRLANSGFNWIIPLVQRVVRIDITENMIDAEPQEIITDDNLNATVDAQVYFKVKTDEESLKNSQYEVKDYIRQIVNLARTTLRNILGDMTLKDANSKRNDINRDLMATLAKETKNWGIEVVRTEIKEIEPPKDVQETMNQIVKAENEKLAAKDFANAKETEADGIKRAAIKEAEGVKESKILEAQGKAKAFDLINKSFKGNAKLDKQLDVTRDSLKNNSKIILTDKGITPQLIIGEIPTTISK